MADVSAFLATPFGATLAGCVIGAIVAIFFCLFFTGDMRPRWK